MARSLAAVLWVASIWGCGGDQSVLSIQLLTAPPDDPFAGIDLLRVEVERDRPGNVVLRRDFPADAISLELPAFTLGGAVRILLAGLAGSEVLSRGCSSWVALTPGELLEIDVCFCSVARIEAGDCLCGS